MCLYAFDCIVEVHITAKMVLKKSKYTFPIITSQLTLLRTTLNRVDFKFISTRLWSEALDILRQHMHKKEFWILTNKCGNKLKHETKAKGS